MRVLFCEDEPTVRRLIELSMPGTAHECRLTADGAEALATMRGWRPDVLVTDVAMPGMDGIELAAAVRADPALRGVRIVFMTASIHREAIERVAPPGGTAGHLRKPFGPAALRELLDRLAADPAPSS
jgi:CheY-like chemotaxis protein